MPWIRLRHHCRFFFRQLIFSYMMIFQKDMVESEGKRFQGLFPDGRFQFAFPYHDRVKHPFTRIQVRYFLSTISGFPGKRGWLSLYLNPCDHRNFLTRTSGLVSLPLIAAMLLWRCSMVILSGIRFIY